MSKLRKSARGQECQVRIPGVCSFNTETTVLAHLNGGGMGMKQNDAHASFACSSCHTWLDRDYVKTATRDQRDLAHLQGMVRTQKIWIELGLLEVKK